jgi:diguanylate cyclase (GGDEF)-like protein/PAS domain S-box-containing protein
MSVLLLEDDPDAAGQVLAALGGSLDHYRTEWAGSLHSACAALIETDFDCVMIGLGLPEAEGLDVVEVLRDAAASAALMVLTDRDEATLGFRTIQGGVDGYLVKGDLATSDGAEVRMSVRYAIERARLKTELQLAEQSARVLSAIVESTADAILTKSVGGVITTWNRGAEQLYGYAASEVVGRHVNLLHPWDETESRRILSSVDVGETLRAIETVHRAKSGDLLQVSLTVSPLRGPEDEHLGASVIARDISDRRRLEKELTRQATHDALTGLPNRSLLEDRLQQALARSTRSEAPVAVLFLDLDEFKAVNDTNGHLAGDELLVEVARRLCTVVRPADTVARWGGDEFVVVCQDSDVTAARGVSRRIMASLRQPVATGGRHTQVSASLGVAVCPPLASDAERLLRYADAAMYEAKARGGGRVQFFDDALAARHSQRLDLSEELGDALRQDALEVHYQPVMDIGGLRRCGVEALARWNHPDRGPVPPSVFVSLAEDTGLIWALDRWVLRRACRDAATLRELGVLTGDSRMAVNLSARTLGDPRLVSLIREVTHEHDLPAEALTIEVTETAVITDPVMAGRSLETLHRWGIGIALDDFGTGYSSLTNVRQLPVTHIKIDRSFISNITKNPVDRAIAASIIELARGLRIDVVAEGVETVGQLELLRRLDCRAGQGYLWSRAIPLAELTRTPGGSTVLA